MTPPIDIRPDHLRIVREVLHRRLPAGVKVWVFGSRAGWATKDSSDLDLALDGETKIPRRSLSALETAFEDSDLPYAVDIVDLGRISERFRRIVMKQRAPLPENHGLRVTDGSSESPFGSLPPGWECSTLGAVCERGGGGIQTGPFGSQLHASDYRPVGIPSIMPQNLGENRVVMDGIARIGDRDADRLRRYLVSKGDIVYSRRGDVEKRALIGPREHGWLCGTGCLRVRVGDNGADPTYASYYLGHPAVREWIVRHAHGATMPNLNTAILSACPFVVPPLSEQRAIAHVLGTLDDRIELNRRMNATLEAMARALFKSWFVDFDPVRAKMEGRDTGLPKDVADLFPDRLVDSESGPIPEGWSLGKLDDVASLNPESWNARNAPDEVAYVDLANTKWGRIETVEVHSWSTAPSRARRVLRPGDTIVGTVRPGNGSYALIGDEGLTGSTGFAVLRPRTSNAREIVWCAATCRTNIDRLAHLADGGAYPAIRPHAVAQTRIVLSDISVRRAFSSLTAGWFDRMENDKRASRKLAALRDALLAPLVSGEFRVRHDRMGGLLAVAILQPVERSRNS